MKRQFERRGSIYVQRYDLPPYMQPRIYPGRLPWFPTPQRAAISVTQHGTTPQQNVTTSFTVTLNSQNLTSGSLIVVGVTLYTPGTITSVKDPTNGNYTQATSENSASTTYGSLWYFPNNASTGSSLVITVTPVSGSTFGQLCAMEVTGLATSSVLDQTAVGQTTLSATVTSGSFTTTTANQIIIAYASSTGGFASGGGGYAAQSGYTITDENGDSTSAQGMQYKIVSSIQSGVTTDMVANQTPTFQTIVAGTFKTGGNAYTQTINASMAKFS